MGDFGAKSRARSKKTIRVASHGAVLFVWDTKDLTRLMLADPRVESVISTLLRGDITLKLRDSQSLTNRACGQVERCVAKAMAILHFWLQSAKTPHHQVCIVRFSVLLTIGSHLKCSKRICRPFKN